MDWIRVVYHVACAKKNVKKIAQDIALEQTVEVPAQLAQDPYIQENILGRVQNIEPMPNTRGRHIVTVDYNAELAGKQIPQFLNLVFGNISLKRGIRVQDIQLPESLLQAFLGPRFGIQGLRKMLGVYGRPLLSTALKPKGSSIETFAKIAYDFTLGGGDVVKDDHNLVDDDMESFRERISRCHEAVEAANAKSGRKGLYFPSIMASVEIAEQQLEIVMQLGIRGVLISPMVIGMDTTRFLAKKFPVVFMAHPTFAGANFYDEKHGMEPGLFLGKLFRLIGCDVSVFPNYGGRFTFSQDDCHSICDRLREPMGSIEPAFPAPAGGMKFENIESMSSEFGPETVFLIGGALLSYSDDLAESTRAFLNKINEHFNERLEEPESAMESACELPSSCEIPSVSQEQIHELLKFNGNFDWEGREAIAYKASTSDLPFKDVTRYELIGKNGEKTAFDLRYFQIEPGGYSSREKHNHTHVIIGARGKGVLDFDGRRLEVNKNDVAYVQPMQVHQLKNEEDEPFGFYCIVDHKRDKPVQP